MQAQPEPVEALQYSMCAAVSPTASLYLGVRAELLTDVAGQEQGVVRVDLLSSQVGTEAGAAVILRSVSLLPISGKPLMQGVLAFKSSCLSLLIYNPRRRARRRTCVFKSCQ